jgi:hypothetical protein
MSTPEIPDEVFDENTPPAAEHLTTFAADEDDNPESHMSDEEAPA